MYGIRPDGAKTLCEVSLSLIQSLTEYHTYSITSYCVQFSPLGHTKVIKVS